MSNKVNKYRGDPSIIDCKISSKCEYPCLRKSFTQKKKKMSQVNLRGDLLDLLLFRTPTSVQLYIGCIYLF